VVDYIVAQAKVTERKVTREELAKAVEDDQEFHAFHEHDHERHDHHHEHDHEHRHEHDHEHDHDQENGAHGPDKAKS
jgi:hypothetical protein